MTVVFMLKAIRKCLYLTRFIGNRVICVIRHVDIFKRLIFSFLSVILLPIILISVVSVNRFSDEINRNITDFTYKWMNDVDANIKVRLSNYEDLSYRLSANPDLTEMLAECRALRQKTPMSDADMTRYDLLKGKIGQLLTDSANYSPQISNIEIVSDYDEYNETAPEPVDTLKAFYRLTDPFSFRSSALYQRAIASYNYPVWWDTSKSTYLFCRQNMPHDFMENSLTLMRSVYPLGDQKPLGVIVINISLHVFDDLDTYQDQYTGSGSTLLMSSNGIVAYLSGQMNFMQFDDKMKKQIMSTNMGSFTGHISGTYDLITVVRSAITGWSLVSVIPQSSLESSIMSIRALTIRLCLACIAAALFLSYLVTASIARPISHLKNAMQHIDESSLTAVYRDDISDEVGILGQRFNSMIERIRNLIHTVYEAELAKRTEMLRRRDAELNALQMQINPHFLYNTLDLIRWQMMTESDGESRASRMLLEFSKLLQLGTKRSQSLVTLREELEHVTAYINVVKFDTELQISLQTRIDTPSLTDSKMPKLLLQPLVENAVRHGFSRRKDKNIILIHARGGSDGFTIKITDNGCGMSPRQLADVRKRLCGQSGQTDQVGLNNIVERIRLYAGEKYGIRIHSRQGKFTSVTVYLPSIR